MILKVAHTPDPDDAFMFYALLKGKVDTWLEFEHVVEDIETLNRKALKGIYDVTAISAHAYMYVKNFYRILSAGSSVGYGYGPIVVAKKKIDLKGKRIAVPGKLTTAYYILKMALDNFEALEMRFDEVVDALLKDECDAALLIHDLQLGFKDLGLVKVFDLWEWWYDKYKLPLPLGLNVIKRDLSEEVQLEFLSCIRRSIEYALKNVDEALEYAMQFSRIDKEKTKIFVLMYVNEYTYDVSKSVVDALKILYNEDVDVLS